MKPTKHTLSRISCMLMAAGVALSVIGCDAADVGPEPDPVATLAGMDIVERVELTVMRPGSAQNEAYVLEVTLDPDAQIRYPEAFRVFGMDSDGKATLLRDEGSGHDRIAGDRIYTAPVDRSCLEEGALDAWAGKDIVKVTLTCSVEFIAPGDECPGEGICPDTATRSFLWGLIEYDVDVVTCWCFDGCDVDFEFSL